MGIKTFQVGIYSSSKIIYEGRAVSLVVPAESGFLGVLADHAPIAAKLSSGKITIRTPEGKVNLVDSFPGGFLEVARNQATLLL
ncbi:MAG: F0F1 ATP synthase subunit epsilon [Candidatus Omnitrophica bacterium]|nr:F0F1 ATP synthase subunit epsilon [Candidatus Omnitrophota bacterium]